MKNERFEACFREYHELVFRYALSKIRDYTASEEITQKVFVALYENLERVKPGFEKAWLFRCAKNAITDAKRREKARDRHLLTVDTFEEGNVLTESYMEDWENRVSNLEFVSEIFQDVRRVNEKWFEALMIFFVEGLSYEEAAKKLNIETNVLRGRIYRARKYIRENYSEKYREGR